MLFKDLDKLGERDFAFFRIPFESGRQTLPNIRRGLILGVFMQALFGGLFVYAAANPAVYPANEKTIIISLSFLITAILILLSLIFYFPGMYQKKQHIQYLISSLSLYNISGISLYFISLLLLKTESEIVLNQFIMLSCITLFLLILFFITIIFRIIKSLKKGNYKRESDKFNYRKRLKDDREKLSRIPELMICTVAILFIVQAVINQISYINTSILVIILLCILLPYISVYMFAHSLITYYCKKRFASFNFDEEGNLQPSGSRDRVKDKRLA